jgi:hypothetical protein
VHGGFDYRSAAMRSPGPLLAAIAAAAAMISAAGAGPAPPPASAPPALTSPRMLPSPASSGSLTPHLSRAHDGEVWMSWLEPRKRGGHALRVSQLRGHGWSTPFTAVEGDSFFVNWADRPGVAALGEGCLAAWWLWTTSAEAYSYDVRIAFSGDRGRTWSIPTCPHRDGTATEHGFVTLVPEGEGVHAVWLDGRNFAAARARQQAVGKEAGHEVGADMTVRSALIGPDGSLADEAVLDGRACDCCPTDAVATMSGLLVAYRDRSPEEVRDISLVRGTAISEISDRPGAGARRFSEMAWNEPDALHADGWKIPGCPVNGPALDAEDDRIVAAWYSEAADSARVLVAFSRDGGRRFGAPVRVDGESPLGRVDVALLEDRSALVLWIESRGEDARILGRRVTPDGARSEPVTIAVTSAKRASGYPRMVRDGRRVIFAWTEAGKPSRVRVAEAMASEK